MSRALREFQPDVVLCDHAHAAFDARAALVEVQAHRPAAPLILVSSALDEQMAVASVRSRRRWPSADGSGS